MASDRDDRDTTRDTEDGLDAQELQTGLPEEVRHPNRSGAPTAMVAAMAVVAILMVGLALAVTLG